MYQKKRCKNIGDKGLKTAPKKKKLNISYIKPEKKYFSLKRKIQRKM